MQVHIVGRHMTVTPDVEARAQERFAKLDKYFSGVRRVEVVLALEGHGTARKHVVEATVTLESGNQLVGRGEGPEMVSAIDMAAQKLEKQTRRYHSRIKGHRNRARAAGDGGEPSPEASKEETYDEVVREMLDEGKE